MSRSTIQDKISGRSSANLVQALSIVEALAEHARLNGVPLPPQETDQGVWRERIAAPLRQVARKPTAEETSPRNQPQKNPWNIEPLMHAQMYDLIEIVKSSQNSPTDTWLPSVIAPMLTAKMSVSSFMERAAQDDPQTIVRTVVALHEKFPPPEDDPWGAMPWTVTNSNMTVGALLTHAAKHHGATFTPALIVGMRRAEIGELVETYLTAVANSQSATGINRATTLLRAASLDGDAVSLLRFVGSKRRTDEAVKIVNHFYASGNVQDSHLILNGMGGGSPYTFRAAILRLKGHTLEEEFKTEVLRGIPYKKHELYAKAMADAGDPETARLAQEAADIPPF
ncbi:hypothetical protein [Streptomyces sp. NPDC001815]|uniref:hypothetical protein n=1 Tax=Streptomyces sp. NPDC001815 TaxID=3154526 RepID=UPI00332355CA